MLAHPIPSPLDPVARVGVAGALQPMLVELVDLALTAKQLHWNVVGAGFVPLHARLDVLAADARTWADAVAERLTAIGSAPDGRAATVASNAPDAPAPEGFTAEATVLAELVDRLGAVAGRIRGRVAAVTEHDPVSADLLVGILGEVEKHRWMAAAQRG
ncbi:MAG: Dps family protein [Nitriliruptoraceae bacterium]